jgi:hypothetical protein
MIILSKYNANIKTIRMVYNHQKWGLIQIIKITNLDLIRKNHSSTYINYNFSDLYR